MVLLTVRNYPTNYRIKLINLILMCAEHHQRKDQNPVIYTFEVLKTMKRDRERRVKELVESCTLKEPEVVMFQSPIKGRAEFSISIKCRTGILIKMRSCKHNRVSNFG